MIKPQKLEAVEQVEGTRLLLRFKGSEPIWVDLADLVAEAHTADSGLLVPLREPAYFMQMRIDQGALAWPNGMDYCPDALWQLAQAQQLTTKPVLF
jgi:hypothetical protein